MECNGCNDIMMQPVQFAFASSPHHPILEHAIKQVLANALKKASFFDRFGKHNKVIHMTGPGLLSDAVYSYILSHCFPSSSVTPHGEAGDVLILPWWFWGSFRQGDTPPRPNQVTLSVQLISHSFTGSWLR